MRDFWNLMKGLSNEPQGSAGFSRQETAVSTPDECLEIPVI
jgi:hypothetical protein